MNARNEPIYLDYHATTPLDPAVAAAMRPWWEEGFGNPHSGDHWFGWQANQAIEDARIHVAALIGADIGEIIFTSGATEANNLAILGAARGAKGPRKQILVSTVEHKCVLEAAAALGREGWQIDTIPVDHNGTVQLESLRSLLSDNTAIVSIMAVNNEIGTIQPIKEIGEMCQRFGALYHCDAAQAPSAMQIDVLADNIALLSLSSHKIYGPKGVGALFVRHDVLPQLEPISYGGGQEQGVRSGTLPTPLCVGFGHACRLMSEHRKNDISRIMQQRDRLWAGIHKEMPAAILNGPISARHPGNLNVCFKDHDAAEILGNLQPQLAASTGSACTTGIAEPSHVHLASGLSLQDAESSIRFGVGRFTTDEEIDRAILLIANALVQTSPPAARARVS